MKKTFTSRCGKRFLLTAALVVTSALSALAGGEDWYAYHVQVSAYPTGAGVVYVDTVEVAEESRQYADKVTREFTTKAIFLKSYAKANEGWQLLGFAKDTIDAVTGNVVQIDSVSIVSYGMDYFDLSPLEGETSKHIGESGEEVSDDSLTVAGKMPLDPNNYFRAIFTHVAVQVNSLQTTLGSVKISKLSNDIGDKVTIEAIPASSYSTFDNWTVDGVEVSKEAKLEVEVKGIATYVANFKDSRSVTLHFPAEGGYQIWYNDKFNYMLNNQLESYSPLLNFYDNSDEMTDSINAVTQQRVTFLSGYSGVYIATGKTPAVFYGMGDVTISPESDEETIVDESYGCSLFRWSGDEGVKVEELPAGDPVNEITYAYYTFDFDNLKFSRITAGQIAPKQLYMRAFTNMFMAGQEVPEVVYFSQAAFEKGLTGISTVKGGAKTGGTVYDLQGRRVSAPARGGIYVTDGRKIIYRQK